MTDLENGPPSPEDGPEEKAAKVLNATMVMLLAAVLAAFALWSIFDFLRPMVSADPTFSWRDVVLRMLIPITLLPTAASMFRFGFRLLRPRPPR